MKKRRTFLFLASFAAAHVVFAQDQTIGGQNKVPAETGLLPKNKKVMVIPFEERMYYSEFDKELAKKENLNFKQIREIFRKGIDTSLYKALFIDYHVISMLGKNPDNEKDLEMIYAGITYNYETVPAKEEKEKREEDSKAQAYFKKAVSIQGKDKTAPGHLVSKEDNSEKYMATVIENRELLLYLNKKYSAEYFIFVNQLDIKKNPDASVYEIEADTYLKDIKIHFTVLSVTGERLGTGLHTASIDSKDNSIYSYIQKGIKPAASHIADYLSEQ